MHDYSLLARPPAQAMELSVRSLLHGQASLPIIGECPQLADGSMGPTLERRMDMALGSHQCPSTPTLQGQQFVVGQRLEIPVVIGSPSSSRNYMANSSAHVQARGIFNIPRLLGQHAHRSVHRTNGPKGLGWYTALLMSEDADARIHKRAVARQGRRVQGHTWFYRPPTGGRHFIATSALHKQVSDFAVSSDCQLLKKRGKF